MRPSHSAVLLVVCLLFVAVPTQTVLAADIHDAVTGRSSISKDPAASMGVNSDQDSSDAAFDDHGRVHVVWRDKRSGHYTIMYARSDDGGRSFGPSIRVNDHDPNSDFISPSLGVDAYGNPHIAWEDQRNAGGTDVDIYYARSYDGGNTFGPNVRVNSGMTNRIDSQPCIDVAEDGKVNIAFRSGSGPSSDIYISTSKDGGVSFEDMLLVNDDASGKSQEKPALATDATGVTHIVWADYRNSDYDVYYASHSITGTISGNLKVNDNSDGSDQTDPRVAIHPNGPVVVWRDHRDGDADIYIARKSGPTSFTSNRMVNTDVATEGQSNPDVDVSADDVIHVVWEEQVASQLDIFMSNSSDAGVNFDGATLVNRDITPLVEQNSPSVSAWRDGTSVVTWTDKGNEGTRGLDVLCSVRLSTDARPQIIVSDDRTKAFEATPSTALGLDGSMHVVWVDNGEGEYDVYHAKSNNGGTTWGLATQVNEDVGGPTRLTPDVALGPDGTVHVAWTSYQDIIPHIYYANNRGKPTGFNAEVRVDDTPASGFAVDPSIVVAPNGSVTVAWLDGRGGTPRVKVTYSRDTGQTWEPSIVVPGSDTTSTQSQPELAIRDGLVALAFTDDMGSRPRTYLTAGTSVTELGAPQAVDAAYSGTIPLGLQLALDTGMDGQVHLAWVDARGGSSDVWYYQYDISEGKFSTAIAPVADTSAGPRPQVALAAGDGGSYHLAWTDLSGDVPEVRLRTLVPGLEAADARTLPTEGTTSASCPALAFGNHQLSVAYLTNTKDDPDVSCAIWQNSPPPDPTLLTPVDDGSVIKSTFNLTMQPGTDADGDPISVWFEVVKPDGNVVVRPWDTSPRFELVDSEEGLYTWRGLITDGYGVHSTGTWSFSVDIQGPSAPVFEPEPEFTARDSNTLFWSESTDPGGSAVSYRVVASRTDQFGLPYLADSGWIEATNHTFEGLPATIVYYRLSARDVAGNTVEAPSIVSSTQDNEMPKVFLSVFPPLTAEEEVEVNFDASSSTDDNGIASFEWDFDEDGTVDSTDANATWSYDEPGDYNVTVTITDVAGNRKVYSDYIMSIKDVSNPTLIFSVLPGVKVDEDVEMTFDATGTQDSSGLKAIRWFIGDAEVPFTTDTVMTYTFNEPGTFTVKLEAVDVYYNRASENITIEVADKTEPIVEFNQIGPFDNRKVEYFTLYVNVTDNLGTASVTLWYKTQEQGLFGDAVMSLVPGSQTNWFYDDLAPGGKGNATYYIVATDDAGNENRTDKVKIRVTGVEDPTPNGNNGGDGFDIGEYLWLIVLVVVVIVAAVTAFAAMGRRRPKEALVPATPSSEKIVADPQSVSATPTPVAAAPPAPTAVKTTEPAKETPMCAIEEVYFIVNDGRLIHAASAAPAGERDQDIFAGMFTAIQDFIKDSMSQEGDLGSFDYGGNRIIIERGKYITCAVTIYGDEPKGLRDEIEEIVRHVEGSYAGVIERWDGDKSKLKGFSEFGRRILGICGGIDRETVLKSKEKKGVKLLSEVEFFQGFVRLKAAVKNDTDTVITDAALDLVYDDNVLRLDHIQPVYEYKRGKVYLSNINAAEKKTVAFNFDPIICMESMIDGTLTYRDVSGKLQVVSMKSRRADIVCPIFFTRENANTAMLKRLIREELASQDSKVFRYPDGLAPLQAFELCKGVVHLHDVKFVREFVETKPAWLGEAWFYGETKVKGFKIVIRVTVREQSHTTEFFVASTQMEVITGLLAEMGHSLNRMLKEKYMGRLKAQPIVDQRLKKDLSDQPLLLERDTET